MESKYFAKKTKIYFVKWKKKSANKSNLFICDSKMEYVTACPATKNIKNPLFLIKKWDTNAYLQQEKKLNQIFYFLFKNGIRYRISSKKKHSQIFSFVIQK